MMLGSKNHIFVLPDGNTDCLAIFLRFTECLYKFDCFTRQSPSIALVYRRRQAEGRSTQSRV